MSSIGFRWIFFGLIFLFNPNVNIIDVMPDLIGYVMIYYGLRKLRDLSTEMEETMRRIGWLIVTQALKTLALVWTLRLSDGGYLLVFTFLFAVWELWLVIPAVLHFCNGMLYLSIRHGGDGAISYLGRFRVHTLLFLVFHQAITLAPELLYLRLDAYGTGVNYVLAPYKTGVTLLALILALFAGIFWLAVPLRKFYRSVAKDTVFLTAMQQFYDENFSSQTGKLFLRRYRLGRLLLLLGIFLTVDFYVDAVNCLPDFLSGILLLLGCLVLRKDLPLRATTVLAGVYAMLSGVFYKLEVHFAEQYYHLVSVKLGAGDEVSGFGQQYLAQKQKLLPEAMAAYRNLLIGRAVLSLLLIALLVAWIYALRYAVLHHTGFQVGNGEHVTPAQQIMRRNLLRRLTVLTAGSVAIAVSEWLTTWFLCRPSGYGALDLLLHLIFVLGWWGLILRLGDEAERRYA